MLEKDKRFLVRSSAFVAAGARGQAHLGKRKSNLQYTLRKTPFRRKKAASGDLFSTSLELARRKSSEHSEQRKKVQRFPEVRK